MANFKTTGDDRVFQFVFGLLANMRAEFTLRDSIEERAHFLVLSVNLELHATVCQVADPASNVETFGDVSYRPAEADPLNVTFVKYLERNHPRSILAKE
jgi:hypothetical protein